MLYPAALIVAVGEVAVTAAGYWGYTKVLGRFGIGF